MLVMSSALAACDIADVKADAPVASSCPGAADWSEAHALVGEHVELVGEVMSARYVPDVSGEPTFLNIGVDYPDDDRLTVVIWGDDRTNFANNPEDVFAGKRICVRGEVSSYNGISEVIVSDPSQLSVD